MSRVNGLKEYIVEIYFKNHQKFVNYAIVFNQALFI